MPRDFYDVITIAMERRKLANTLTNFQAHARGYLMRKEIKSAREDFEDIVREIDGELDHLEWRERIMPIPHFTDTDGPFNRHTASSAASKRFKSTLDLKACPSNQLTAPPLEETTVEHHLPPEKTEPERDGSPRQGQASLSRICPFSSPPGGDGEGETESSQGNQVEGGEGGVMESTGDTTTIWSSLGLDMTYSHSHKGPQRYCLAHEVPRTPEALRLHRNTLTMELLWLQQAIASRKKYLSLKERMGVS